MDTTTDCIREISLAPGEFEGVAQQFVDWVDARTQELLAGTLPEAVKDAPGESGSG